MSIKARRNLESVLTGFDRRMVRLEVRDVTVDPLRAEADRIVFTPTLLLRGLSPSTSWVVGDLADEDVVINLLRLGGIEPAHSYLRRALRPDELFFVASCEDALAMARQAVERQASQPARPS